jgi:hypothetical protein
MLKVKRRIRMVWRKIGKKGGFHAKTLRDAKTQRIKARRVTIRNDQPLQCLFSSLLCAFAALSVFA